MRALNSTSASHVGALRQDRKSAKVNIAAPAGINWMLTYSRLVFTMLYEIPNFRLFSEIYEVKNDVSFRIDETQS